MSDPFPKDYPLGSTWLFDIGVATIEHQLRPDGQLHYRVLSGPHAGNEEVVPLDIVRLRPQVFLVSWQEAAGITVVHVEDFENQRFHSRATLPGGRLMRTGGEMRRVG
ncbi:MAG TPA: hypothetical protein VMI92_14520 [Steroidobacteraceae bacterium]|nr:hypothetical protein [Steroidobacteraceae bacterium]